MRVLPTLFRSLTIGVVALTGGVTNAELVYVADGISVGRVDTSTGSVLDLKAFPTMVNNSGIMFNEGGFTDIAFSATGQLYGITGYSLWSLDYGAGTAVHIGQMSGGNLIGVPNALTFGADGTAYIGAALSTVLHTIDIDTASRTSLANEPLTGGFDGDLAFIDNHLLVAGTTGLHSFDLSTDPPTGSTIGQTGVANLFGLATPDRKALFGFAGTSIYSIDPATANSTFLSSYGGQGLFSATGAAFQTESITAVPEPSSFAFICVAAGAAYLRHRRTKRSAKVAKYCVSK